VNAATQWVNNPFNYIAAATNMSSHQCIKRRESIETELKNILAYQENPDAFVNQSMLLDLLELTADKKSLLTRTVKAVFPNSAKKTVVIEHEATYPLYKNILFIIIENIAPEVCLQYVCDCYCTYHFHLMNNNYSLHKTGSSYTLMYVKTEYS
jgi:hypothetical protein